MVKKSRFEALGVKRPGLKPGGNRVWLVILSHYRLVPTTEVKIYVEVANG